MQVTELRKELTNIHVRQNEIALRSEEIDRLDQLTGRIKGATQFRAINLIQGLTTSERNFLARLFRSLLEQ